MPVPAPSTTNNSLHDSTSALRRGHRSRRTRIKPDPEEADPNTSNGESDVGTSSRAKRKRPVAYKSEEDSEEEWIPESKRGRRQSKEKPRAIIYKARASRAAGTSDIPGAVQIDCSVLAKIKKCFERAEHRSASEHEARSAIFVATKLMRQYNVEKADVMQHQTSEEQAREANSSEVEIKHCTDTKAPIPIRQWVSDLAFAMSVFFNVKTCNSTPTDRSVLRWIFYGIAQNTASAALAFEKIYNIITDWASFKTGVSDTNSYCLGVASKLLEDAKKDQAKEMEMARQVEARQIADREEAERLQRERELDRLQPTVHDEPDPAPDSHKSNNPGEADNSGGDADVKVKSDSQSECSFSPEDAGPLDDSSGDEHEGDDAKPDFIDDDEKDDGYLQNDEQFDNYLKGLAKREKSSSSPPAPLQRSTPAVPTLPSPKCESPHAEEPPWKSAMQLTIFRDSATRIANQFLKDKGIKLKTRRRGAKPMVLEAYNDGRRDAKKIDVRQKALEEKKQDIKVENTA